jgi:uncharacterized membrane protein
MVYHPVVSHIGVWLLPLLGLRLLFWIALAGLFLLAIRGVRQPRQTGPGMDPALSKLRERLASGEISIEEYEKTLKVLQG